MGLTIGKGTKYDPKTKTGWKREGGKWVYYNKGKKQQHSNILGKIQKNVGKGLSDVGNIGKSSDTYSKEKGRYLTVFEERRLKEGQKPKGWNKEKLDEKKKRSENPLKTWRVDSDKNRQLQTERKEGKEETYTKVTKENKNNLSDQHNKKNSNLKILGNETKEQYLERTKNSPAAQGGVGKDQRWAAYQNHLRFKAKKRSSKEERRKRRDALLKKKKNALKIGKK